MLNKTKIHNIYLNDFPVQEFEKDKFQFRQIAEIIKDSIDSSTKPMQICLMGQWGAGKTTVLKMLELLYKNSKDKVVIKNVSVWKFAENSTSLQRKIVREVAREFKHNELNPLDSQYVETDTTRVTSFLTALILPILKNKKFIWITLIYLFLLIISGFLGFYFNAIPLSTGVQSLSTAGIIAYFISLVLSSQLALTKSSSITKLQYSHGDQFEVMFNEIVEKNVGKNQRLIIIFDDMDRLPPNQLYAALNTIRTFLQSKQCTFIVPCDEKVLREELDDVLKEKNFEGYDVSEFLNKTFDLTFRLPLLEQRNMKTFSKELLEDNKVIWANDNKNKIDKILSILIHSSVNTPRQVKKVLNAFASDWELAKKRDQKGVHNVLSQDPIGIAILTVLKTNFPKFYEIIKENPSLLSEFNINADQVLNKLNENNKLEDEDDIQKDLYTDVLIQFLNRVKKYIPKDIRPFIYFQNNKLNPFTGRPNLLELRDLMLNGMEKEFNKEFLVLVDDEKSIFMNNIVDELNYGIETENILNVMFSDVVYSEFVNNLSIEEWSSCFENNIDHISQFKLSNVLTVFSRLVDNSFGWSSLGYNLITKEEKYKEMIYSWKEEPDFFNRLNINQKFKEIIEEDPATFGIKVEDDPYLITKVGFEVDDKNSLIHSFNWFTILSDCIYGVSAINREEEDEEQHLEKSFPINFSEWLIHLIENTDIKITSENLINIFDDNELETFTLTGFDKFIEKNFLETNQLNDFLKLYSYFVEKGEYDLVIQDVLSLKFTKNHPDFSSGNIDLIVQTLQKVWENDSEIAIKHTEFFMDIPEVSDLLVGYLEFEDTEIEEAILELIIVNENKINPQTLVDHCLNLDISDNSIALKFILRIVKSSRKYLNGFIAAGRDHNWFNASDLYLLKYNPDDTLTEFFELYQVINRESENYYKYLLNQINSIILNASNLINTNYKTQNKSNYPYIYQWKSILSEAYLFLMDELQSRNVNITNIFEELFEQDINEYLTEQASIESINKLNTVIPLTNTLFNRLVKESADLTNKEHLRTIAKRFYYFEIEEQNILLEQIDEANSKSTFFELLLKYIKGNFNSNTILNGLRTLNFTEDEKGKLFIENINVLDNVLINEWFDTYIWNDIEEGLETWMANSAKYALNTRNDIKKVNPKIVSEALSYMDERSYITLQSILKSYSKNEANPFKKEIKNLEEQEQFREIVKLIRNKFNWLKKRS